MPEPIAVPALVPALGYSVQDWDGHALYVCEDCIFDTLTLPRMQTHRTAGCRPPDGEWDFICPWCEFRTQDHDEGPEHERQMHPEHSGG